MAARLFTLENTVGAKHTLSRAQGTFLQKKKKKCFSIRTEPFPHAAQQNVNTEFTAQAASEACD